jgi:DNA modification methylase
LIAPKSIDAVITDPPYVNYDAWRDHTEVHHDAEPTIEQQADVLYDLAYRLCERDLIKDKFMLFSFCPLDLVHQFLPAFLEPFKDSCSDVKHQVLVWDKETAPKVGGHRTFGRQAEAIIYINVGDRPLPSINGKSLHSSLMHFSVKQTEKRNGHWKPLGLLKHLIQLATGEQDNPQANNQLILDPFSGSGGLGVAAIECQRRFLLIDSHQSQYAEAKANIAAKLKKMNEERKAA